MKHKQLFTFLIIGCFLFSCKRKKELLNTGDAKIAGVDDYATIKAPCSLTPKTFIIDPAGSSSEKENFENLSSSFEPSTGKYTISGRSSSYSFSLILSGKAQSIPTTLKFEENSKESFYIDMIELKPLQLRSSTTKSYFINYPKANTNGVLLYINKDIKSVRYEICDLPIKRFNYGELEYATFSTNFTIAN